MQQSDWRSLYFTLFNAIDQKHISAEDSVLLDALHRKAFPEQYPWEQSLLERAA